jgi:hypothetical protein
MVPGFLLNASGDGEKGSQARIGGIQAGSGSTGTSGISREIEHDSRGMTNLRLSDTLRS